MFLKYGLVFLVTLICKLPIAGKTPCDSTYIHAFTCESVYSKRAVLVAKRNLPQGAATRDVCRYLELTEVLTDKLGEAPIDCFEKVFDRALIRPVAEGAILTLKDLSTSAHTKSVALVSGRFLIPAIVKSPEGNWQPNVRIEIHQVRISNDGTKEPISRFQDLTLIGTHKRYFLPNEKEIFFVSVQANQILPILLAHFRGELELSLPVQDR